MTTPKANNHQMLRWLLSASATAKELAFNHERPDDDQPQMPAPCAAVVEATLHAMSYVHAANAAGGQVDHDIVAGILRGCIESARRFTAPNLAKPYFYAIVGAIFSAANHKAFAVDGKTLDIIVIGSGATDAAA